MELKLIKDPVRREFKITLYLTEEEIESAHVNMDEFSRDVYDEYFKADALISDKLFAYSEIARQVERNYEKT